MSLLRSSSWGDSLGVLVGLAIAAAFLVTLFVYLSNLANLVQS